MRTERILLAVVMSAALVFGASGCGMTYRKVTEDDYWSGDARDGYGYNTMVSIKNHPDLNTDDSEHIGLFLSFLYKTC